MLNSVAANGRVPNAEILLAGFGLTPDDHTILCAAAGRHVRLIEVTTDHLAAVEGRKFTREYPPAVLGRLFLADQIIGANARLLTLDSDMIVNTSLEPLFDLDMGPEFFAAIHDPPRHEDPNYFNTGMTLFDVDIYRYHNIARRCLEWLAENPHANFPDQDALNEVVGHRWHRLDRLWNWFYFEGPSFTPEDYELGKIAHFAGAKPWDHANHPGASLYKRHLRTLRIKLDELEIGSRSLEPVQPCGG